MRHLTISLAGLAASCGPAGEVAAPEIDEQSAASNVAAYEASEFEPTWSLKLIDGKRIEFRQLDPETGDGFITESYRVIYQTGSESLGGFTVHGGNEKGDFMFSAVDVSAKGGCTHSATGDTHRDQVNVASPRKFWIGCGGPILESR